jgi:hypothetical protein
MNTTTSQLLAVALCVASAVGILAPSGYAVPAGQPPQQAAPARAVAKRIGAIKAINGSEITLTPDSGPDVKITVQAAAQIVRLAPGETSLNNATTIQLQDLQVGDRIRATGWATDDNLPLPVLKIVVMTHSDLEARHQQDLQDWQKRGVGGLVGAVDPAAGTVTISVSSFAGKKNIVIHSSNSTVIRRYAPDSVKFDDAKPSTLQQIHPGDQVRARGDRSADGADVTAQEIVSGSFPGIAGTVNSVDASSSTLSVHDLLSNKTVVVKITPDSQLRHLPLDVAQRFAMFLKGGTGGAAGGAGSGSGSAAGGGQTAAPASPASGVGAAGSGAGARSGGSMDFQRVLSRQPAAALTDLHKGDAVIVLSTEGTAGIGTVITLVSGVEPILQAAPSASTAAMLTPWNMGAPAGDAGGP